MNSTAVEAPPKWTRDPEVEQAAFDAGLSVEDVRMNRILDLKEMLLILSQEQQAEDARREKQHVDQVKALREAYTVSERGGGVDVSMVRQVPQPPGASPVVETLNATTIEREVMEYIHKPQGLHELHQALNRLYEQGCTEKQKVQDLDQNVQHYLQVLASHEMVDLKEDLNQRKEKIRYIRQYMQLMLRTVTQVIQKRKQLDHHLHEEHRQKTRLRTQKLQLIVDVFSNALTRL
jgi:hypothetical protein